MKRFPLVLLVTALVTAGCGGPPPAGRSAAEALQSRGADAFFPARPGTVWRYDVVARPAHDPLDDGREGTETVRVEKVRREGAFTVLQCRANDTYTQRYRFPEIVEGPGGVSLRGVTFWGAFAADAEGHLIDFLRFPLAPAVRWDDGAWIAKVEARERVTVPAGTFDAWKLDVIGTLGSDYTAVGTYWVARGAGIVKSELTSGGVTTESVRR